MTTLIIAFLAMMFLALTIRTARDPKWTRIAAGISAACDVPVRFFYAFFSALFDKWKFKNPGNKTAKLWYYGVIDAIVLVLIFGICYKEVWETIKPLFTDADGIIRTLANLTPIGLAYDAAYFIGSGTAGNAFTFLIYFILVAIVVDISFYVNGFTTQKREKSRLLLGKETGKWDSVSRVLFGMLYMFAFTLLAQKSPASLMIDLITSGSSFLVGVLMSLFFITLAAAFYFRVYIPMALALAGILVFLFTLELVDFIFKTELFASSSVILNVLMGVFVLIWNIGMIFALLPEWARSYDKVTVNKETIRDISEENDTNPVITFIIIWCMRVFRFEIGDNLRDIYLNAREKGLIERSQKLGMKAAFVITGTKYRDEAVSLPESDEKEGKP